MREQASLTATADSRLPSVAAACRRGPSGLSLPMCHFTALTLSESIQMIRSETPLLKKKEPAQIILDVNLLHWELISILAK
jgi:hypothetical protein